MLAPSRPLIVSSPSAIAYASNFTVDGTLYSFRLPGKVQVVLSNPGFHTHGVAMSQRMVMLGFQTVPNTNSFTVTAPGDASIMQPGVYLLFLVNDGIPSEGVWVMLQ